MIHNALIIDTETTGTEATDRVIEVGCILYSVEHAAPLRSFASLIHADANPAEHVNHIPAALLADAPPADYVWNEIAKLVYMGEPDVVVAHNADPTRASPCQKLVALAGVHHGDARS